MRFKAGEVSEKGLQAQGFCGIAHPENGKAGAAYRMGSAAGHQTVVSDTENIFCLLPNGHEGQHKCTSVYEGEDYNIERTWSE